MGNATHVMFFEGFCSHFRKYSKLDAQKYRKQWSLKHFEGLEKILFKATNSLHDLNNQVPRKTVREKYASSVHKGSQVEYIANITH